MGTRPGTGYGVLAAIACLVFAACVSSGDFGLIMGKELVKDPDLRGAVRVPIYAAWGQAEAPDHGRDAAAYLAERGWPVETEPHPGGHILPEETVRGALSRNR